MAVSAIALGADVAAIEGGTLALGPEGKRIRSEVLEAVRHLRARGAIAAGSAANFSALLPDAPGHVLITSRGLPADLSEEDFGVVTLDGEFVSGRLGGGIRSVIAMHTHAYSRPGVTAAIHTHSPHATAFAVAHKPIPPYYEPLLTRGQTVEIPVTTYGGRNSGELVNRIDGLLAEHPETRAILLANHGLLVFHETPKKAAELTAIIDEAAALFIRAAAIGGAQPIAR
ncbi:class II aldolase/adducin family protein [Aquabacter sp. CN5-332]|uniref:class II aldolase/adducin family protein n=1 Tax=Aquabacter sp. CN5-332 TaxID=3156608 RepID=UPI0032B5F9F7